MMPSADSVSLSSSHVTGGTRAVFSRGLMFDLEDFSSKDFIVKDFIETLSESAIANKRKSVSTAAQAFDPKPLIRTFDAALSRLSDLSGDLELRENELSAAVRRAELQHQSTAETLGRKLNQTIDSFRKLDITLNGSVTDGLEAGGNAAVQIGAQLEELERQRRRAQDAKFLIQCWLEVSERGELMSLEDLRHQGSGDGKVRSAHIARQLLKISQRLDPISWSVKVNGNAVNGTGEVNGHARHNTRELIEKFLESLEQDLLKQFEEFYRKLNFEGMRDCATVLYDFNDGASVMGLFVNTHQFFIDRSQLITEEVGGDAETWEKLADPDAEPPGVEPSLQSLVDEVKVVVQDESTIIKRAFPYYEQVLGRFLQRVFQQSIQQRLEMVLDKANSVSSLAFLRSLQAARSYISTLVEDLKAHGLTEHPESISSQTSLILDQQLDDLFVPYFVGSSYIEREKRNLEELYSSLLFKFTIFHSRRKKGPTTFMASLAKSGSEMLASARDAAMDRLHSSDLAPAQKRTLLRVAGLKDSEETTSRQADIEVVEEDGVLSILYAKRMLKWLAEGVGRGLELSGGNETPKDVSSLLDTLLTHMGEIYLETALDAAVDQATAQDNIKTEPDFSFFPNLRPAITIMNLMLACINTVLLPLAASNITIRRGMEKATNLASNRMEDKVNMVLQRTIDAALSWITRLLGSQKKTDYRPRDDAVLEMLQTPTCLAIFNFLTKLHNLVAASLPTSSPVLPLFHLELAIGLRSLLLSHYQKFTVNAAGGLMVTKDLTKYIDLLRSWDLNKAPSLQDSASSSVLARGKQFMKSLEVFPEIGNLFVIGPEALRERLRGVGGGKGGSGSAEDGVNAAQSAAWEKRDLRPYLVRREDAGSAEVQALLSSL